MTTSLPVFTEPGGAVHQTFWPGLLGSGITSSRPVPADSTHSSAGWHIMQQYTPALAPTAPQPTVSTSVFAICARKSINNQAFRVAKTSGVLLGPGSLDVPCQQGEFTVGGGYTALVGVPTVSEIHESAQIQLSSFVFNTWRVDGDSQGSSVDALALCIRIPTI